MTAGREGAGVGDGLLIISEVLGNYYAFTKNSIGMTLLLTVRRYGVHIHECRLVASQVVWSGVMIAPEICNYSVHQNHLRV